MKASNVQNPAHNQHRFFSALTKPFTEAGELLCPKASLSSRRVHRLSVFLVYYADAITWLSHTQIHAHVLV